MHSDNEQKLKHRVIQAAEAALAHHQYVSAIDVLAGMGALDPSTLEAWRKGRLDFLERQIRGNLKKISLSMKFFRQWAAAKGLRPSETIYRHKSHPLRFSKSGGAEIERAYRTHYVSPQLAKRQRKQIDPDAPEPLPTSAGLLP